MIIQKPPTRSTRFDLVIFDCDGVLVDSELITSQIFAKMLCDLGLTVSLDEMFEKFVGRSMAQCRELMARMLGHEVPPNFVDEYHARTTAALTSELKAVAGIETTLENLGIPYCVASSGTHDKMRVTLGVTGLLPRFAGRIFSVTEVARSKPFPDVFLHAAATLKVPAKACVVIEDSPTGVTAGVAAGMTVFGYCARTPRHKLLQAGAHSTFDDMRDLPQLLSLGSA